MSRDPVLPVQVKRDVDVEATIVGKFVIMAPLLDERARRLWAAAKSAAIG